MNSSISINEDPRIKVRLEEVQKRMVQLVPNECWVILYANYGYQGDFVEVIGPGEVPDLRYHGHINMNDKISSIMIGKNAICRCYRKVNFIKQPLTFLPDENYSNLSNLGYNNYTSSFKVYSADNLNPPY